MARACRLHNPIEAKPQDVASPLETAVLYERSWMAKSKRSAALFEVIQSSRLPKRQSPLARWWAQHKVERRNAHPAFVNSHIQAAQARHTETVAELPAFADQTSSSPMESGTEFDPRMEPSQSHETSSPAITPQTPKQPIPGVDLQLDPDHQQITFKVSYYSAIVSGFTILVVISLAYLVGRKMNHGPIAATASPSSAELRSQPAHPDVLDVARGETATQTEPKAHPAESAQLASAKTLGSSTPTVDSQRIIGRQYVVIQIYADKKSADDAAALLNKKDLPCTVENGLAGWASKSWWCVVGTTGFDHIRDNPEYARYQKAVNKVSDDQTLSNPKFKRFEPRAYRWKESTT